jgi:methyl coenzyme M reductase alpha subunit
MNIVINGTDKFQDYPTFMRAVVVAIDECLNPDDNRINLYSTGGYKVNQYAAEFVNRSERYLKQKGIKARYFIIPRRDAVEKYQ